MELLTAVVNSAWRSVKNYSKPESHRQIEQDFYHLTQEMVTENAHELLRDSNESRLLRRRISDLRENVSKEQIKYIKEIIFGAVLVYGGAQCIASDSHILFGLGRHTGSVPEYAVTLAGIVHTVRSLSLYLNVANTKKGMSFIDNTPH
jgi:hypothetical protein